jgi:hypothetical protein
MKLPNLFLLLTPSFRLEIVIFNHYCVTLLNELSIHDLIESSVSKQISLFKDTKGVVRVRKPRKDMQDNGNWVTMEI